MPCLAQARGILTGTKTRQRTPLPRILIGHQALSSRAQSSGGRGRWQGAVAGGGRWRLPAKASPHFHDRNSAGKLANRGLTEQSQRIIQNKGNKCLKSRNRGLESVVSWKQDGGGLGERLCGVLSTFTWFDFPRAVTCTWGHLDPSCSHELSAPTVRVTPDSEAGAPSLWPAARAAQVVFQGRLARGQPFLPPELSAGPEPPETPQQPGLGRRPHCQHP